MKRHTGQVESPDPRHRVTGSPNAGATHAARPSLTPARAAATLAAIAALGITVGLGVAVLLRKVGPTSSSPTSAKLITVTPSAVPSFPVHREELAALTHLLPDLGPLADSGRRIACLQALGYPPSIAVRGGRRVDIGGRPGVVLVLPGPHPADLVAVAVRPDCTAAAPGLVAETTITSP